MLEWNDNDCAREARPRLWMFRGRYTVLVVVSAMLFMMLFGIFSHLGVDLVPTIALSLAPGGLSVLWVVTCVNGKPESYTWDLLLFGRFQLRQWLFSQGVIGRPPEFNLRGLAPQHPTEYE